MLNSGWMRMASWPAAKLVEVGNCLRRRFQHPSTGNLGLFSLSEESLDSVPTLFEVIGQ